MDDTTGLPAYVDWPIFPFEGDLRVKPLLPLMDRDLPRSGEPGGGPCPSCAAGDEEYVWVDERWRVRARDTAPSIPMVLFLETRDHLDLHELDDDLAADLGRMLVRVDRAVTTLPDVGRTHASRWGDGGSHFHMWIYGRPFGSLQTLGFGVPLWMEVLPPIDDARWRHNLSVVATELARGGGTVALRT